jgi:hypothetical protein
MSQGQKDFLALSHGQEWVAFYESFDKLVQDNLARSSDLLRRAMSLPEVADREVQQVRSEMEGKIAAERSVQRDLLSALQQDLSGSHRQVSMLARGVGAVIGDLERLTQRVNEALSSLELKDEEPAAPANGVAARANGLAYQAPAAPETPVFAEEPEVEVAAPVAEAAAPASDFSIEAINAAVEEQAAMLEAAENQIEQLESAIDLTALAEAEGASDDATESVEDEPEPVAVAADGAASAAGERPRPHWLSVTRVGART